MEIYFSPTETYTYFYDTQIILRHKDIFPLKLEAILRKDNDFSRTNKTCSNKNGLLKILYFKSF